MANWYRKRRKAPREKNRMRVEGMTTSELAAKVGVTARTSPEAKALARGLLDQVRSWPGTQLNTTTELLGAVGAHA